MMNTCCLILLNANIAGHDDREILNKKLTH